MFNISIREGTNVYLKKVVIHVRQEIAREDVEKIINHLWTQGIEAEIFPWESDNPSEERGGNDIGLLWIVDDPLKAKEHAIKNEAVCIYLHAKNQKLSFPDFHYAVDNLFHLDGEYLEGIFRRFYKIPWDIIDTKRCHIRETTVEDVEEFYKIYQHREITRYTENLYEDKQQERDYIRAYIEHQYAFYDFGVWTILLKSTGEIIGRAGLSLRDGYDEPELGFVIGFQWQKQGYAFEVCEGILQYAREHLGFDTIQALIYPENHPSRRLCEKLGFVEEDTVYVDKQEHVRYLYQK